MKSPSRSRWVAGVFLGVLAVVMLWSDRTHGDEAREITKFRQASN